MGKKLPADLIELGGVNHMGKAELDARRDREVHVPSAEEVTPPAFLPKKLHKEFLEIGEILNASGLFSELDRDVLGQYFLCRERWIRADKEAAKAIRDKDEKLAKEWTTIQASYFKQTRQAAEAMGLSVTSRCRIVVPNAVVNAAGTVKGASGEDEFTKRLHQRQAGALRQLEG